jgi:hypothetical protein
MDVTERMKGGGLNFRSAKPFLHWRVSSTSPQRKYLPPPASDTVVRARRPDQTRQRNRRSPWRWIGLASRHLPSSQRHAPRSPVVALAETTARRLSRESSGRPRGHRERCRVGLNGAGTWLAVTCHTEVMLRCRRTIEQTLALQRQNGNGVFAVSSLVGNPL